MPEEGVARLAENLMSSERSLNGFRDNPERALRGYDLNREEREIFTSQNPVAIRDLMSKNVGDVAADVVNVVVVVL